MDFVLLKSLEDNSLEMELPQTGREAPLANVQLIANPAHR